MRERLQMKIRLASLIFCAYSLASLPAYSAAPKSPAPAAASETQNGWHKAETKRVCMVTDMEFPRDQIPVKVKDTTYYGCCENCKDRLSKDAAVREATDPISGKKVDKAKASIAAGPDGAVVYFENDANLQKFIASKK